MTLKSKNENKHPGGVLMHSLKSSLGTAGLHSQHRPAYDPHNKCHCICTCHACVPHPDSEENRCKEGVGRDVGRASSATKRTGAIRLKTQTCITPFKKGKSYRVESYRVVCCMQTCGFKIPQNDVIVADHQLGPVRLALDILGGNGCCAFL